MAEREVRIKFTGESGVLKGQAAELRTLFGNLMSDTDDVRSAGEKWAAAHKQQSARIRAEMDDVTTSAAVLADSLGAEMVAALERSGRSVEEQVQELVRLGLTHDDIRLSSDQLADALRDRDAALRQSAGEVGDGFKRVAAEADNSRSVMANMVGNSAQDLGELAGITGTAGVAIGQLAEYATEGNISLAGLAKAAGPMLVLGLAVQSLADASARAEARAKALKDAQEAVASGEAERAAKSLVDSYGGLYDMAARLGISTETLTLAITGNADAYAEADLAALTYITTVRGGVQEGTNFQVALARARDTWVSTGQEIATTTSRYGEVEAVIQSLIPSLVKEEESTRAAADAAREAEEAQRGLTDARLAAIDSGYAVRDAQDRYTEALERAAGAQDDAATGVDELRQAQDDAVQAALGVASATLAQAEAQAEANGQTLTGQQRNAILIESLYGLLTSISPDSPLAAALRDHIATLQGVPSAVNTNVTATGTQSVWDQIQGLVTKAGEVPGEVPVDAAADVDTAVAEVDRLKVKIGELPTEVSVLFQLPGAAVALADLERLRLKLREVERAADDAEWAVARVAD